MGYKDAEKQREANREASQRRRDKQKGMTPGMTKGLRHYAPGIILPPPSTSPETQTTTTGACAKPERTPGGHIRVSKPGDADYTGVA